MLKKSVVIANRHSTSISLEPEFMEELEAIAKKLLAQTEDRFNRIINYTTS